MSSDTSVDLREVIFVNRAAEEAYRGLPDEVRQAADARTTAIQNHQALPRNQRQSLSGKLAGIDEVRILSDGDTYRVYHLVEFAEVIYILDAGMKKSPTGSRIPKPQSEMLEKRKRSAQDDYDRNRAAYGTAMQERLARRRALASSNAPKPHGGESR
jgi:phage-related protein